MSLHDTYARRTPFELVFESGEAAEELLRAAEEEATARGLDAESIHAFVTLGSVASFVHALESPDDRSDSIHPYAVLAYHCVSFARAAHPLFLLSAGASRYLLEGAPGPVAEPPSRSGYIQLPQHLFWLEEGSAPESIDGLFWSTDEPDVLHTLLVTGVREDRPGVGVVPLPEAPLGDLPKWLETDGRGDGTDFESDLPGAELDRLYGVRTAGEVLKLLGRFFSYVGSVDGAMESREAEAGGEGSGDVGVPSPSALAYTRVDLVV